MIVFHYYFEKNGRPKFYQPIVDLMKAAYKATMDDSTLHAFVYDLRWKLEVVKPSGHGAYINFSDGPDGFIHLESGKVDDDIARLHYFTIQKNLSWDYSKDLFYELPSPVF